MLESGDKISDPKSPLSPMQILPAGQWAKIANPYDATSGKCKVGHVEVRVGPAVFPLWPGEIIMEQRDVTILKVINYFQKDTSLTLSDDI